MFTIFKGILALFRTRLILNPMVMIGIFIGVTFKLTLDYYYINALYSDIVFYLLMLLIASSYVYMFKCVYFPEKHKINWKDTFFSIIGHFFMLIISFYCTINLLLIGREFKEMPGTIKMALPIAEQYNQK